MSWILASTHAPQAAPLGHAADAPLHEVRGVRTHISAGGHPGTCLFGTLPPGSGWSGFVVVGIGLMRDGGVRALDRAGWAARLARPDPATADLDGHFVALRWRDDGFEVFTDRTGLRPAFVTRAPGGVLFSTHLHRIVAARGGGTLDVARLGSAWLLHNQVAPVSLAREVVRLMPGTSVAARGGDFALSGAAWEPEPSGERMEDVLRAHLSAELPGRSRRSLGLSGGLDSRLLLALAPEAPALHVFGPPDHPDARIAREVAARMDLPLRSLHDPLPDADACIRLATRFCAEVQFTAPASAALQRRYYARLDGDGFAVLDGGFGEIGRRQFLNRALLLGRADLRAGRLEALASFMRLPRPTVFTADVQAEMQRGVAEDLQHLGRSGLFSPSRTAEENLDRFAIRARLTAYAFEQARLDAEGICLMPYAQPSFLQAVLGTPLSERRGGRRFRGLLRASQPALTRVPLVKGTQTYPFRLGAVGAATWTAFARRLRAPYAPPGPHAFLDLIGPFVRDEVLPEALRTSDLYDRPALTALVEDYYAGSRSLAAPLDAWLAFELWRREVGS